MQTPRTRTALLSAIAIGAVATMGLGFTLWTQQLSVAATVETGTLNVAFQDPKGDGKCTPETLANGLAVTVKEVGPDFTCTITAKIANRGTVAAEVTKILSPGAKGITFTPKDIEKGVKIQPNNVVPVSFVLAVNDEAEQGKSQTLTATLDFVNATPVTP